MNKYVMYSRRWWEVGISVVCGCETQTKNDLREARIKRWRQTTNNREKFVVSPKGSKGSYNIVDSSSKE
jgi:hypothetical protein